MSRVAEVREKTRIEIVVRVLPDVVYRFPEELWKHLDGKKGVKKIFSVPIDWDGFSLLSGLREDGLDVYVALSYTTQGSEKVLGRKGDEVKPFVHNTAEGRVLKYLKVGMSVDFGDEVVDIFLRLNCVPVVEFAVK